ncbi:D-alanyl-D-alanine carboxypeptidase DacF precursor [Afipia felis]|uniref:D-alanyl-D-alanine carboxypeptidase DacF n=1 Tax=Afipia felis TaxID=1035 RepID=A0A090MJN8_AFIFE|nr:D-alanyl-D-alanine carboxypeptidase [Afipia felis]CEG07710.1 D-alanyl-D-alanine carboxypeptidase DacF precursor [Afipia felis]
MLGVSFASGRTARYLTLALAAVSITLLLTDHADARRRHHRHHRAHVERSGYNPPFASIVVDANSGATLQSTNADALRHPASLTKIMTLYMLFEQLDSGKLRLDSQLEVSRHASVQAPTKLGLRPGQTIRVEDAIKGIVTRSANDAAVVVAEAIGGSEENFCKMMTRKARALGMSKTTYVNASGLPDDDQITTARDQATLGRAIQDRFPTYYRYFSTSVFTWRGSPIRNHNHLLGQMDGVDGIKTGYVRASGFNLVTNIRRGNRHLVGVVLGGRSGGSRDATMRRLLAEHLDEGATRRTVAAITERNPSRMASDEEPAAKAASRPVPAPIEVASAAPESIPTPAPRAPEPAAKPEPAPLTSGVISSPLAAIPGSSEPMKPVRVKTVQVRMAQAKTIAKNALKAALPRTANAAPVAEAAPEAAPTASVAASAAHPSFPAPLPIVITRNTPGLGEATVGTPMPSPSSTMAYADPNRGPPPTTLGAQARAMGTGAPQPQVVASAAPSQEIAPSTGTKPIAHSGWIIQVGALESESEARQRLNAARENASRYLGRADPFTEVFSKGRKTYYRARFAGLSQDTAEAACKVLKRSDISCMTIRN